MKAISFNAADRGKADYGWLKANYYFSFAGYQDRQKLNFGLLRVLNDDFVAGCGGFPTHPHDNMEIVTIPLSGALSHKDSTGGQGTIGAGDVQIMSAGTGVEHSEFNASQTETCNLFQLWVYPKKRNIEPRYDQKSFDISRRQNKWQTVVSPISNEESMWINQDAQFSLARLDAGKSLSYTNAFPGNGVFLLTINGSITVNEVLLNKRDAIGISEADSFFINANEDAELLAVEIPMDFPK